MLIHFHNLKAQYQKYHSEINDALKKQLESCAFIMGKTVDQFESELAMYLECDNLISCGSGTDALMLALLAIGVKEKDEIITSAFSFVAAAEIASLLSFKVKLVDIDETYNIDINRLADTINSNTRAIIPISLFGHPPDMNEINTIASYFGNKFSRKIYVIEDAAQSFGATYKNSKSGTLSDIGCFSFFPTKPLGCYGDGGALSVQDNLLAEKIRHLRQHGQTKKYHHRYIGINSRLDALQAAILSVKLKHFEHELTSRGVIAKRYLTGLSGIEEIKLTKINNEVTSSFAQFSIRVTNRDTLARILKANNIPTAIHYPIPIHLQECFRYLEYSDGDFPIAEQTANEILSLPMCAFLEENAQNFIINTIVNAMKSDQQIKLVS